MGGTVKMGFFNRGRVHKGTTVAVFDIQPDSIQSILMRCSGGRGNVVIQDYETYRLTGEAETDRPVLSTLQRIGHSVQKTFLAVPRYKTIQRLVDLPEVEATTLSKIIGNEAETVIPWEKDERIYSVDVILRSQGRVKVLLTAANLTELRPAVELLDRANISLHGFISTDIGLFHALSYLNPEWWQTLRVQDEPSTVVRVGAAWSEVLYLRKGLPFFSRAFQHQPNMYYQEIAETVQYIQNKLDGQGSKVYVVGSLDHKAAESIGQYLHASGLNNQVIPVSLEKNVDKLTAEYLPLFGVGLIGLKPKMLIQGFMGDQTQQSHAPIRKRMIERTGVVLAVGLLLASGVWAGAARISNYKQQLADALRYKQELQPTAERALELEQQLSSLQEQMNQAQSMPYPARFYLGILSELATVLPSEAWAETLVIENGKIVEFAARGPAASTVLSVLHESPRFKELSFSAPIVRVDANLEEFRLAGPVVYTE